MVVLIGRHVEVVRNIKIVVEKTRKFLIFKTRVFLFYVIISLGYLFKECLCG